MIVRIFFLGLGVALITALALLGFRGRRSAAPPWELFPDMDRQPKVKAQSESRFFADGRGARPPVEGTVPHGYHWPVRARGGTGGAPADRGPRFPVGSAYGETGKMGDRWGDGIPVRVDMALMTRGRERFDIFCGACHGRAGLGDGVPGEFGLLAVANLQERRIREMPDGQIFHTIGNGKNTMKGYGDKITVPDRWAIVAYLRALQMARGVEAAALPAPLRAELEAEADRAR